MSGNREEILENFMIVTRIKNVEEAIIWLESCNWDLNRAIKNSSPEELKLQNDAYCKKSKNGSSHDSENIYQIEDVESGTDEVPELRVVQAYVVHGSKVHMVRAPDNITVHCFKRLVSFATNVPPCQQVITGWTQEPTSDSEILSFMPNLSFLMLEDSSLINDVESRRVDSEEETLIVYNFRIFDESHDRIYNLKVPGNRTVAQVKMDVYLLTDIPLARQLWNGWPENARDHIEIRFLVLDDPVHTLEVRFDASSESISYPIQAETSEIIDIDETSDIFEVDGDDIGQVTLNNARLPCLIPNSVEDEMAGSVHFIDGYLHRYGQATPSFFTGTLEDAVREAYHLPIQERRMLAVYLHHDGSVLSNVFCTQLLGSEAAHQILSNNFVVWGWDLTNEVSRRIFLSSAARILGSSFARTVESIHTDSLPALFVIAPNRGQYEMLNVIYGNNGIDDLLSMLVTSIDIFSRYLEVEAKVEEERAARQKIKFEQDTAYEESLVMDRAKEEAKRQKRLEESLEEERHRKEMEVEDEKRLAKVAAVESQLPTEPAEQQGSAHPVFSFKFRTPSGETFGRRFLSTDALVVVFNFLFVKGYHVEDFKFITGWPRKDLTLMNSQTVLKDLGIFYQETIFVEAR